MLPALPFDAASLLGASARRWPDRIALRCEGTSVRYDELHGRVRRLAASLCALGVGPGDRVVVLLPNSARFVESWWAVISTGAIVVPANHRSAREELHATIADCRPRGIITDRARFAMVEPLCGLPEMQGVLQICTDAQRAGTHHYEDLIARGHAPAGHQPQALDAPCAIYYTAGTTGRSKGVVRSHLSVAWGLAMIAQRMSRDDVLLARAPMAHAGGSLTGPFAVLLAGGTLVIPERTDALSLLAAVQEQRVSRCYLHPVLSAKALIAALDEGKFDLRSLRLLQWTAGPLPEAIRRELFRRFPDLPLEVTYGMSEVSNIATYLCGAVGAKSANCVGYAWPGSEIAILAPSGELMPAGGGDGEVLVRSPTAMSGYWNSPELTASVTRNGWLHTGDIGRLDEDGALFITGRIKEAINSAGMTVHAAEVEHALAAHPEVADAAVFGLPHPQWEEAVTAVVARRGASALTEAALLEHCRGLLSNYKLPKKIIFVSELPRNASNKIDKRALRERHSAAHRD